MGWLVSRCAVILRASRRGTPLPRPPPPPPATTATSQRVGVLAATLVAHLFRNHRVVQVCFRHSPHLPQTMDGVVVFSFVLLCALSSGMAAHESHLDHLIDVTVYYESMCKDSIDFITKQLHPALEKRALAERVNLTLVPYGKSTYDASTKLFTCDHGYKECDGNKLHACALKKIQDGKNTDKLGYNSGAFDFIDCLMKKLNPKGNDTVFPVNECTAALPSGVVPEAKITNCQMSPDAMTYLQTLGNVTDAFQKPLKSVPTVVFNKTYKDEDDKLAKTNFVKALCKYIDHDKPDDCSGASAPAAFTIGIVALFTLTKIF